MNISVNRNVSTPIYLQIKNQIRDMIFSGELLEGFSLPPERKLGDMLNVNRSTVIKAYQELKSEGLIESYVGKGTVILPRISNNPLFNKENIIPIQWYQYFNEVTNSNNGHVISDIMEKNSYDNIISFAGGFPSPDFYPTEVMKEIQDKLFKDYSKDIFLQCPVEGHYPLRESISQLLKNRQISVSPKEIMILSGSQQGLDFVSRVFINPGDILIVEEPTYLGAIEIFRSAGAKIIGVPIDEEGIRVDILKGLLVRHKPKLIYTLPNFQNPSGVTMSLERRYELLNMAYNYRIPIVEDDPYGELRYNGITVPSLKALDHHGYVIYLSTFSKVLFLGLRVGWIAAPQQVLNKFAFLKQITDLHVNTPGQWILDTFIRQGCYGEHLRLVRKEYALRRDIMLEVLEKYKLSNMEWSEPEGGFYIWCRLPENIIQTKLMAKASEKGVFYVPGEAFYPYGTQGESYIRLNFTYSNPKQIRIGIKRLMEAIEETIIETTDVEKDIQYFKKPIV